MIRYIFWIFGGFIMHSCNSGDTNSAKISDSMNSVGKKIPFHDSLNIKIDSDKLSKQDTATNYIIYPQETDIAEGMPKLTPLPFSGKGYYYVTEFVKSSPTVYRLPHIKRLEYFPMFKDYPECPNGDCMADFNKPAKCLGDFVDTSVFKFKKYRFKLHDIYRYQTYIVCDTSSSNYGVNFEIKNGIDVTKCTQVYFKEHCYLILYDSLTKAAKIIALHHPSTSKIEDPRARTFIIDENFIIHLQDYYIEYGDDGLGSNFVPENFTYDIRILHEGTLQVNKTIKKNSK
jgi:hypothetical protein